MKILVTGVNGQLGYDVIKRFKNNNIEYKGCDIDSFDLTSKEQTIKAITEYRPDAVIHCAAYTAVDNAEDNKEVCYNVNVSGTRHVAEACKEIDAKMIYISTDYVFDGTGTEPYKVTDKKNPVNYYGETKSISEDIVAELLSKYFIIRTSWVFGVNGNNFVKTILRLGKERKQINVVNDQYGSPTYTYDLAMLIADMVHTNKYGIYHASNEGYCSWFEFAREITTVAKLDCNISPISTSEYPTKAKRPFNSRLDKTTLDENGFNRLPLWKESLLGYCQHIAQK